MNRLGKLKAHERTHTPPDHRMRDTALALFGAGALEEIEGILRVASPDEQVRDYLARSLHAYARDKHARDTGNGEVSSAQFRRRVEAICKAAQSLQAALPWSADDDAGATVALRLIAGGVDVGLLSRQLDAIAALEKIEMGKGGGRPLDDPEHWLLLDRVADVFERTTHHRATLTENRGKCSFSGDFFRMAELVEAAAAAATKRRPATNSALGSRLRRLLNLRAKPPAIF
jgi:hypothetical protein